MTYLFQHFLKYQSTFRFPLETFGGLLFGFWGHGDRTRGSRMPGMASHTEQSPQLQFYFLHGNRISLSCWDWNKILIAFWGVITKKNLNCIVIYNKFLAHTHSFVIIKQGETGDRKGYLYNLKYTQKRKWKSLKCFKLYLYLKSVLYWESTTHLESKWILISH